MSGQSRTSVRVIAAALLTIAAAAALGAERGFELLALLLAFAAAIYVGVGLQGSDRRRARIEWIVALGFAAAALAGLWIAPAFLAAGWIGHGAWDWVHHRRRSPAGARWYPSACLAYDWVVGGYVVFLLVA